MKRNNLPKEFIELNAIVKNLNTGITTNVFGENRHLLLQGSKVKGYQLFIVNSISTAIVSLLHCGNKKSIIDTTDTIERISIYNAKRLNSNLKNFYQPL